jgi:hypothetical protein
VSSDQERRPDPSLRGITARGASKVGVEKAMRARDVSRPGTAGGTRAERQGDGGAGSSGSSPDRS